MDTLIYIGIGVALVYIGKTIFEKIMGTRDYEQTEKDSGYEEEDEDEEEPDKCYRCKKNIREDDESYTCEECDDGPLCKNCVVEFEESGYTICKKCIDKNYPRGGERIVYKEKIVEVPQKMAYKTNKGLPKYEPPKEPVEPIFEDSTEFD